jgi:hypothetical protein
VGGWVCYRHILVFLGEKSHEVSKSKVNLNRLLSGTCVRRLASIQKFSVREFCCMLNKKLLKPKVLKEIPTIGCRKSENRRSHFRCSMVQGYYVLKSQEVLKPGVLEFFFTVDVSKERGLLILETSRVVCQFM